MVFPEFVNNKTDIAILNSFNEEFSHAAIDICPLLSKFQIIIVNHYETKYASVANLNENDTFAYYLNKESEDASSTYAEIIVNKELCDKLLFTGQEYLAAVAHEIGHIIFYFRSDKELFQGEAEEIVSDSFACRMGLAHPLSTLINKLISSGLYSDNQIQLMRKRLSIIEYYESNGCFMWG